MRRREEERRRPSLLFLFDEGCSPIVYDCLGARAKREHDVGEKQVLAGVREVDVRRWIRCGQDD